MGPYQKGNGKLVRSTTLEYENMLMTSKQYLIHGLDHVQIAIPCDSEVVARKFYSKVLGLTEIPVPATLRHLGAIWFEHGSLRLHLGMDPEFHPARKAHPALLVRGLDSLAKHLAVERIPIMEAEPIEGFRRFHVLDPFGNRIEFLEPDSS